MLPQHLGSESPTRKGGEGAWGPHSWLFCLGLPGGVVPRRRRLLRPGARSRDGFTGKAELHKMFDL